jgi:hypothetical protein
MRLVHAKWWSLDDHGDTTRVLNLRRRKRKPKPYGDQGKDIV